MNDYDVVIIGAGPAGLACANMLKNTRLCVLIVDKNLNSYSKPCAGALTRNVSAFYYPENKARTFTQACIHLKSCVYEKSIAPVRTISRKDLFTHMAAKIKNQKNITLKKKEIKRISDTAVVTKTRKKIKYKFLVGADGSMSAVRRYLKLPSRFMMGMYVEIPRITDVMAKIYDSYDSGCEYMWVFPHRDHTNVGMGFNPEKITMKRAKQVFFDYLKSNQADVSRLPLYTAPLNYDYKGCVFDNIYLIGDAAGLVIKTSGEGISQALISGEEIGWKIAHPEYPLKRLQNLIKRIRRQNRLYNLYRGLPFLRKLFIKHHARERTPPAPRLF